MTLKELRQQSGKTVAEVATALGIANRTLSHYECGTRHINIEQVIPLSKLYDCTVEDIIVAQLNAQSISPIK